MNGVLLGLDKVESKDIISVREEAGWILLKVSKLE